MLSGHHLRRANWAYQTTARSTPPRRRLKSDDTYGSRAARVIHSNLRVPFMPQQSRGHLMANTCLLLRVLYQHYDEEYGMKIHSFDSNQPHIPHDLLWCFHLMFHRQADATVQRRQSSLTQGLHSQIAHISRGLTGSGGGCNLKTKPILPVPCQGWEMFAR